MEYETGNKSREKRGRGIEADLLNLSHYKKFLFWKRKKTENVWGACKTTEIIKCSGMFLDMKSKLTSRIITALDIFS